MAYVAERELTDLLCKIREAVDVSGVELVAVKNHQALVIHLFAAAEEL